jgi:PTS system mannose-specific IIB component/fructoselysine and glucoselysine-specific PTS system IIB component
MSIQLYRVDERLIHGQVVVGWGNQLRADRIIVIDDDLAVSAWEQDLYTLGLPADVAASFETVASARAHLSEWRSGAARVILLTRDIETMLRLAEGGSLRGQEVNIGGLHYAPGREAVLPYLYLSEAERTALERLVAEGVTVSAQDLPGARRVSVERLLRGNGRSE